MIGKFDKVVISFISMIFGWLAGHSYFWVYMTLFTYSHRVTDAHFMKSWTAVFILLGWILFSVPLIFLVKDTDAIFKPSKFPFVNALVGMGAFLVLCSWMGFWKHLMYWLYAAVVGASSGYIYSLWLRYRISQQNNRVS